MKTVKIVVSLILIILSQTVFSQCWKDIAAGQQHSLAIKADGTLWAWGRNQYGQLGDGTAANKSISTQIGSDTDWASIYAYGFNSIAQKTDGSLWAWGDNSRGQIGDGNHGPLIFNSTPTLIGTDTDWLKIASSGSQTYAIKSDGTLWGWGKGQYLGNGDLIDKYTPFQIEADTNWSDIVSSLDNRLALKTDNSLWGWGQNSNGALGTGTITTPISVPTQIGNNTNDWSKISTGTGNGASTSMMLKTNGSLWGMGMNERGTLGIGSTSAFVLIPGQVATDTDWVAIKTGGESSFGLKANGTLWGWGLNNVGQLGDGTLVDKNVPVAIGIAVVWQKIVSTNGFVLALSSDNTLYSWGWNNYGHLGDGTLVNKNLPSLIGNSCPLSTTTFDSFNSFQLYPNPTESSTTVSYTSNENTTVFITIANSLGQLIYNVEQNSTIGANQQNINLSSYSAGIYFVTLKSQHKRPTIKLIKNQS